MKRLVILVMLLISFVWGGSFNVVSLETIKKYNDESEYTLNESYRELSKYRGAKITLDDATIFSFQKNDDGTYELIVHSDGEMFFLFITKQDEQFDKLKNIYDSNAAMTLQANYNCTFEFGIAVANFLENVKILNSYTGLRICNYSKSEASISITFQNDSNSFTSSGWVNAKPQECIEAVDGPLQSEKYYIYAENGEDGFWGGEHTFCIKDDAFELTMSKEDHTNYFKCKFNGLSYYTKDFAEIDVGKSTRFTYELIDTETGNDNNLKNLDIKSFEQQSSSLTDSKPFEYYSELGTSCEELSRICGPSIPIKDSYEKFLQKRRDVNKAYAMLYSNCKGTPYEVLKEDYMELSPIFKSFENLSKEEWKKEFKIKESTDNVQTETSYQNNTSDVYKLFELLAIDQDVDYNMYDWNIDPNNKIIQWNNSGIQSNSFGNYPYKKEGTIQIENNQWNIMLLGARGGYTAISIDSPSLSFEPVKLELENKYILDKKVCVDGASYSSVIYSVKLENKKMFWLQEDFSGGTGGGSYSYSLVYNNILKCE